MSKFHSTVSRRDFMKFLGLVGMGAGAAGAAAPVFHDLDEVVSSEKSASGITKKPWWASEREYLDATVPIDWSLVQRFDERDRGVARQGVEIYQAPCADGQGRAYEFPTKSEFDILVAHDKAQFDNWEEGVLGMGDTRQHAFAYACRTPLFSRINHWDKDGHFGFANMYPKGAWGGYQSPLNPTHAQLGMPKWQGTPEDNLLMLRAVTRFWGGTDVGCVPMESGTTEKLLFKCDGAGKPYVWENVDEPYSTDEKYVIPNTYKNCLVHTWRQGLEMTNRQAGTGDNAPSMVAYGTKWLIELRLTEFIRMLGYGPPIPKNFQPSGAFGVLAGMGEHARMGTPINNPRYGTTLRGVDRIMTDMPIAPTKPIDFGAYEFCKDCGICAEVCPTGCIADGDPAWDNEGMVWANGGYLGWHPDMSKCPHCPNCHGSCPFNTLESEASVIHEIVKGTVSTTGLFNGFFATMDKTMGYHEKRDPRDWYKEDHPVWGYDSRW